MEGFNAKDIVMQRAISQNIIDELKIVYQKNNDAAIKLIDSYNNLYNQMISATSFIQAEKFSIMLDSYREKFANIFAINGVIDKMIKRNEIRLKYFDWRINAEKIIKFDIGKKQISAKIDAEKITITDELLNLSGNSVMPVFFNEMILIIKNGKLSLEEDSNYQILKTCEDNDFKTITDKFPTVLTSITDEQLMDIRFKERVLKQIITIIDDRLKKKPIEEINEFFGSPLNFNLKVPENSNEFVDELKNLFKVRVKQYMQSIYPDHLKEINSWLSCDEKSIFLPAKFYRGAEIKTQSAVSISNDSSDDTYGNDEEYDEEFDESGLDVGEDDDFNDFLLGLLGSSSDDADEDAE